MSEEEKARCVLKKPKVGYPFVNYSPMERDQVPPILQAHLFWNHFAGPIFSDAAIECKNCDQLITNKKKKSIIVEYIDLCDEQKTIDRDINKAFTYGYRLKNHGISDSVRDKIVSKTLKKDPSLI